MLIWNLIFREGEIIWGLIFLCIPNLILCLRFSRGQKENALSHYLGSFKSLVRLLGGLRKLLDMRLPFQNILYGTI